MNFPYQEGLFMLSRGSDWPRVGMLLVGAQPIQPWWRQGRYWVLVDDMVTHVHYHY
jgi:hypothetical protein